MLDVDKTESEWPFRYPPPNSPNHAIHTQTSRGDWMMVTRPLGTVTAGVGPCIGVIVCFSGTTRPAGRFCAVGLFWG